MDEISLLSGGGKITATPNPLPWDTGVRLALHWETSPATEAELLVSQNNGSEKLVRRGKSGSCEVEWIRPGFEYEFRLYGTGDVRRKLDAVTVRRNAIPWKALRSALSSGTDRPDHELADMAEFVAGAVSRCLRDARFPEWFRLWEESGFHVSPVHFYEAIPDSRSLGGELWEKSHELVGVDLNRGMQLELLRNVFPRFQEEFNRIPVNQEEARGGFYVANGRFENLDPLIGYCMVRHFRPNQIIEIGGGYSTSLLAMAAQRNENTFLTCIEPYPNDPLRSDMPGLGSLLRKKVEDVAPAFFERLKAGDFLFIDSSHAVRIGGDVNFLFLEILPRLNPGVIVHVHDIFFPFEYPRKWVMERHRFWTEQYLLQAFLAFNGEFEVLLGSTYLTTYYPEELKATFPTSPVVDGGSLWMRRKPSAMEVAKKSESRNPET